MAHGRRGTPSPAVERTIMLSDAVVAIAMTLLILPLVEAVPDVDLDDVGAFVAEHLSLFVSFVVSFLVILLFWAAHQRLFQFVPDMTSSLRLLNSVWLLVIAFLPFPTALIGRGPTTSTVPVYIAAVLALSLVSATMTVIVARSSGDPAVKSYLARRSVVAWASAAVLATCLVVGMVNADLGLMGLLGILVVRLVGTRWVGPAPASE